MHLSYSTMFIVVIITPPHVRGGPEYIAKMEVGDGKTNHGHDIGDEEKHHLRLSITIINIPSSPTLSSLSTTKRISFGTK